MRQSRHGFDSPLKFHYFLKLLYLDSFVPLVIAALDVFFISWALGIYGKLALGGILLLALLCPTTWVKEIRYQPRIGFLRRVKRAKGDLFPMIIYADSTWIMKHIQRGVAICLIIFIIEVLLWIPLLALNALPGLEPFWK